VLPHAQTAVDGATLERAYHALSTWPGEFNVHPKLLRQFEQRDGMWQSGEIDWALGEAMAFGTLLDQGVSVRLTGQDTRRGTFSHRHSTLVDFVTGEDHVPLSTLSRDGARFWCYDSLLSEYAALGFEYGYSVNSKDVLTIWEAQFGDFFNGAQIIIDQFIVAAEDKWGQTSGLVMLLPHGYEGQGPEHSSARIERFLTLAADDNIQVCDPTTAAQYFHLLRRQMLRSLRRPLIVFTPKSLLRARTSRSNIDELTSGTFEEVLDDPASLSRDEVRRVVFASGKVAFDAIAARDARGSTQVAVVRVEQLYPWPYGGVEAIIDSYPNSNEIVWLQEEPENMGSWNFVKGKLFEHYDDTHKIERVSRYESGPAAAPSRSPG
jgi:2-oxoglutarate dehydrogenase E1 component